MCINSVLTTLATSYCEQKNSINWSWKDQTKNVSLYVAIELVYALYIHMYKHRYLTFPERKLYVKEIVVYSILLLIPWHKNL